MIDQQKNVISLYHNGAVIEVPCHGLDRYHSYRAFLDELIGRKPDAHRLPDKDKDFYALNKQKIEAFSTFRKEWRQSGN